MHSHTFSFEVKTSNLRNLKTLQAQKLTLCSHFSRFKNSVLKTLSPHTFSPKKQLVRKDTMHYPVTRYIMIHNHQFLQILILPCSPSQANKKISTYDASFSCKLHEELNGKHGIQINASAKWLLFLSLFIHLWLSIIYVL